MTNLLKSEVGSFLLLALGTKAHFSFASKGPQDALPLAAWNRMWEPINSPFPLLAVSIMPSLHWSELECKREWEEGDWVCVQ